MKNSCKAVLLILFLALFANAQEVPPPLSSDSSLAVTQGSSLVAAQDSSLSIAQESSLSVAQENFSPIANASGQIANQNADIMKLFENTKKHDPKDYQKNLRVSAYLNPLALFFGAANNMFMFNPMVEIPLNLGNSVIIQPAAWFGSSKGYILDVEYKKLTRIGTGIGMRRYAFDKGQGLYLQALAGAYYISAESISYKETPDENWNGYENIKSWIKVKGMVGDLVLYVGSAHKWENIGFFYELGAGFGYDGTDTYQLGYINKLVLSLNAGLGLPF